MLIRPCLQSFCGIMHICNNFLDLFEMEENNIKRNTLNGSMSFVSDTPLPDVNTIINEFNQNTLESEQLRLFSDLKKISDFQKEAIQETIEKAQMMISDIKWQRDQQIIRIKEECSTKAIELKNLIFSLQGSHSRRGSKISKATFSQPLLEFHQEIVYLKQNWLQKNRVSIVFSLNGLEKIQSTKSISPQLFEMYDGIQTALSTTQLKMTRKLEDEGARHFSHILPYYLNLSILTLSSKFFSPHGGKFLASGLVHLKKLYKLSINNDKIREGIVSIIRVLPNLRNLEEVYLSTGWFCEREAEDIGAALSFMGNLKDFTLIGGVLEKKGTKKLCGGIRFLTQLKTLNLSGNFFGIEGGTVLIMTLKGLLQLTSLKLSSNHLGSQAGALLKELLEELKELDELWVNSNEFGDKGACDLVDGENFLGTLNLQDNGIGDEGAAFVIEKFRFNKRLKEVDLSWNSISNSVVDCFKNKEGLEQITFRMHGMNLNEKLLDSVGCSICG